MTPRDALQQLIDVLSAPHRDHTDLDCDGERGRWDCCWQCAALDALEPAVREYEGVHCADYLDELEREPVLTVPSWMRRRIAERRESARLHAALLSGKPLHLVDASEALKKLYTDEAIDGIPPGPGPMSRLLKRRP